MAVCEDLGRPSHRLVRVESSLGVDEVRCEEGVDQRRLSEPRLAWGGRRKGRGEMSSSPRVLGKLVPV